MKIAQLTFNGYDNYGQILQKYALQQVLKRYADTVEVIWNNGSGFSPLECNFDTNLVNQLNIFGKSRQEFASNFIRQSRLKYFHDLRISTRYDIVYLEDLIDEYDYFVVGSDQVWNPHWILEGNFLEFAPKHKSIAYAASIGTSEIPDRLKPFYRHHIGEMARISVREKHAVAMLNNLFDDNDAPPIQHVRDPTMLLTASEWRSLAEKPTWIEDGDNYILTYYLGNRLQIFQETTDKPLFKIINIFDKNNYNHYVVNLEEFIWLIDHAKLFYTDSFHGTVFSLLLHCPFVYTLNPRAVDMITRIYSLLETFNLESRLGRPEDNFNVDNLFEIDFDAVDKILERERQSSIAFLENALGVSK